jgi:hypothetical protein
MLIGRLDSESRFLNPSSARPRTRASWRFTAKEKNSPQAGPRVGMGSARYRRRKPGPGAVDGTPPGWSIRIRSIDGTRDTLSGHAPSAEIDPHGSD